MHTCTCPYSFIILIRCTYTILIYRSSELCSKNPDVHTVTHVYNEISFCLPPYFFSFAVYTVSTTHAFNNFRFYHCLKVALFSNLNVTPHILLKQRFPLSTATLITTSCDSLSCIMYDLPCASQHI